MPFEDFLKPAPPKCKTCGFIAQLEEPLRTEVAEAVAKPIYTERTLAIGMRQVETELNPAPSDSAIRTHRQKGHTA